MRRILILAFCAISCFVLADGVHAYSQTPSAAPAPAPPARPAAPRTEVNADGSITFRLTYPGAKQVSVLTDALLQPLALVQGADGVWTATTSPLPPEHYGYTFVVDGVHMLDPLNLSVHVNFVDPYSDVLVPGHPAEPWELTDIPHGMVSKHFFTTKIGVHFPENQSAYVVYTPPGYDPKRKDGYPVLYLLHGYTDTEDGWTLTGKANLMMDRMLADGKIIPMIVVMPRGYGDFDVVSRGRNGTPSGAMGVDNIRLFDQTLAREVMPAVERDYNVARGRESRAIIGLSMGGIESLSLALNHSDIFAWVGSMSGALPRGDFDTHFRDVEAAKTNLKMLWVACGTDDRLITPNRDFVAWAKGKGLPVTAVETPGAHTFVVWRQNLLAAAPLLFRK
ncbi:alpha/beta hydrolase [Acidicapsa dinghuensis]|uniref:Alpha/beta hydrolase n=1 Tax=Acidicapsa dinghuensis TaxID=2218256 RepID=A0ABW1EKA3_9BACT|nr:alpha/beta hydrolase-fold protein [Acidicapsa dinghuensis]